MPEAMAYSQLPARTLLNAVRGACGAGVSSEPVTPTSGSNLVDCMIQQADTLRPRVRPRGLADSEQGCTCYAPRVVMVGHRQGQGG